MQNGRPAADIDEELDLAAQGQNLNADEVPPGAEPEDEADGAGPVVAGEIDTAGAAAGLVARDDRPFRGIEEVERRDARRWELDPASAEDAPDRG